MIYTVLLVTEVLLSIGLIALILLQHGKGADAGAAFGGGASGTVFGSKGAGSFLSRTTGILAAAFFINCLALAFIISHRSAPSGSVIDADVEITAPVEVKKVESPAPEIPESPAAGHVTENSAATDSQSGSRPESTPQDIPE